MTDQTVEQEEGGEGEIDYTKEASSMGWTDQDTWDGPKDKWVDAKTFVERGESIMPILRANNKKLKQDLLTRDKELATLKSSVDAANKAIKALQKGHTEATQRAVDQARVELREQLKQAREIGDIDAEEEIRDKLDDLKQSGKEVKEEEKETPQGDQPTLNPEFVAWNKENSWYGDMTDPDNRKRTRALIRIGEDLREEGDTSVGRSFMDKCMDLLEKQGGKKSTTSRSASKVEGGAPGARSGGGGRAFDSLPKDAKDHCHDDNDTFVGPGKMFKTVKEWEDHYTKLYNEE